MLNDSNDVHYKHKKQSVNNFLRAETTAVQRTNLQNHVQPSNYNKSPARTAILHSETNHKDDKMLFLTDNFTAQVRRASSQLLSRKVARRKRVQ